MIFIAGREIFIDGVRAVASVTSTLLDDAKVIHSSLFNHL